jgi:hypothetical protein
LTRRSRNKKAYFAKLGHELEWKAYSHDSPADLIGRLRAHGFVIDELEAIVVLDLRSQMVAALVEEPTPAVRPETDPHAAPEHIREELRANPTTLSVYIAEVDGQTVARGWARFPRESSFACLWGGETVPQFRSRGLYT